MKSPKREVKIEKRMGEKKERRTQQEAAWEHYDDER